MLKDITKVKISGAIFNTLTPFDFFNPHDGDKLKTVKGALLYGRNGTGKSTIAKAFRKIGGEFVPAITSAVLYDDADQPVTLSEDEKQDLEARRKNVRLAIDSINACIG